ncbi:glutathione S-transferase family protein [Sodalis sp. (in: enterobacteria)]|uniref:glutathione S-transferase family protein n=1 Tax=Sodalis sp. (in: enterobacteria) TaxID=1898979 RepID=UPI003F361247
MYQLHIANKNYSSWSLRPWVLMKALALPFEESLHPFEPPAAGSPFHGFSPTGKVPVLIDGARTVWDSLAIVEYLAERHAQVWPGDAAARAWARCAAAEMHSGFVALRNQCPMSCGVRVRLSCPSPSLKKDIARLDALWQDGLTTFGGPWLAGPAFSAVDAFYAPVVFRAQSFGFSLSAPAQAWCEQMLALPAMRLWYQQALEETWRDADHEQEMRACGEVIHDFRVAVPD